MIFIAFLLVLVFIFSLEQFHLVWFLVFEHFYFYFRLGLDVLKTVEIVKTSRKTQKKQVIQGEVGSWKASRSSFEKPLQGLKGQV